MLGLGKKKKAKGDAPEAEAADAEKPAAAPEGEGGEGEGEAPKKKGLPIKLIAIAAVALLVLGGGGAAWFFLLKPKAGAATAAHPKAAEKGKKKEEKTALKEGEVNPNGCTISEGPEGVVFCKIPDLMTNTQTTDGRPHNLSLKITFELPNEAAADAIGEQMPRLKDLMQSFLRELRPEDLNGSAGDYRLRQEIQHRVNLVIAPAKVNAVLIEEMLQT